MTIAVVGMIFPEQERTISSEEARAIVLRLGFMYFEVNMELSGNALEVLEEVGIEMRN